MTYPINPFPTPQPVPCDKPAEPITPIPDQSEPDEPQEDDL